MEILRTMAGSILIALAGEGIVVAFQGEDGNWFIAQHNIGNILSLDQARDLGNCLLALVAEVELTQRGDDNESKENNG